MLELGVKSLNVFKSCTNLRNSFCVLPFVVKSFCSFPGPLVNIFYLVPKLFLIIYRPNTSFANKPWQRNDFKKEFCNLILEARTLLRFYICNSLSFNYRFISTFCWLVVQLPQMRAWQGTSGAIIENALDPIHYGYKLRHLVWGSRKCAGRLGWALTS